MMLRLAKVAAGGGVGVLAVYMIFISVSATGATAGAMAATNDSVTLTESEQAFTDARANVDRRGEDTPGESYRWMIDGLFWTVDNALVWGYHNPRLAQLYATLAPVNFLGVAVMLYWRRIGGLYRRLR